ncbi:uncharacterized protein BP5553_07277 [Venustampulla echinocandica]|uniref:Uncharacterized protein n=1 Tax=Venustampulla echinocandica TaxID=2656787 RepID=A0A370TJ18_9HELO|nr:uncharacterized protein BP5553_07277 [Venustampulla echinocandica]RDL35346.1 hypothetical protein BP5553_07277 [Venustampulla echinocandica]
MPPAQAAIGSVTVGFSLASFQTSLISAQDNRLPPTTSHSSPQPAARGGKTAANVKIAKNTKTKKSALSHSSRYMKPGWVRSQGLEQSCSVEHGEFPGASARKDGAQSNPLHKSQRVEHPRQRPGPAAVGEGTRIGVVLHENGVLPWHNPADGAGRRRVCRAGGEARKRCPPPDKRAQTVAVENPVVPRYLPKRLAGRFDLVLFAKLKQLGPVALPKVPQHSGERNGHGTPDGERRDRKGRVARRRGHYLEAIPEATHCLAPVVGNWVAARLRRPILADNIWTDHDTDSMVCELMPIAPARRLGLAFFKAAVFVEREVEAGRAEVSLASFDQELGREANCDANKGEKGQKTKPCGDFDEISASGAPAKLSMKLGESAFKRIIIIPSEGD